MNQAWCDGQWLAENELAISLLDRGASHGLGLFETMLGIRGSLPFGEYHFVRLSRSMERLGWALPDFDFQKVGVELMARNGLEEARVRLSVSAGSGGVSDLAAGENRRCWITVAPFSPVPDCLNVVVSPWRRNEHSALAGLKCASYAENLVALDHARRRGADEVVFLNTAGELCEAAMANVFLVRRGEIFTPDLESGCLPGVARRVLMEMAKTVGILCHEKRVAAGELEAADEMFLTSAVRGPVPVGRLEGRVFSEWPMTRRFAEFWKSRSVGVSPT